MSLYPIDCVAENPHHDEHPASNAGSRIGHPPVKHNMYLPIADACEELYLLNDMDFLCRIILCQHPEKEAICIAIKQTGRMEWLNDDKANPVDDWYLAYGT